MDHVILDQKKEYPIKCTSKICSIWIIISFKYGAIPIIFSDNNQSFCDLCVFTLELLLSSHFNAENLTSKSKI